MKEVKSKEVEGEERKEEKEAMDVVVAEEKEAGVE